MTSEALRNEYINFLAKHSNDKQAITSLLRYSDKAPATEIKFGPSRVAPRYRFVAREFLKNHFITPQTAIELTQELVSEIPIEELLKEYIFLFQLENSSVEIKYSTTAGGSHLLVEIVVKLFEDTIVNQFVFPCIRTL